VLSSLLKILQELERALMSVMSPGSLSGVHFSPGALCAEGFCPKEDGFQGGRFPLF